MHCWYSISLIFQKNLQRRTPSYGSRGTLSASQTVHVIISYVPVSTAKFTSVHWNASPPTRDAGLLTYIIPWDKVYVGTVEDVQTTHIRTEQGETGKVCALQHLFECGFTKAYTGIYAVPVTLLSSKLLPQFFWRPGDVLLAVPPGRALWHA